MFVLGLDLNRTWHSSGPFTHPSTYAVTEMLKNIENEVNLITEYANKLFTLTKIHFITLEHKTGFCIRSACSSR